MTHLRSFGALAGATILTLAMAGACSLNRSAVGGHNFFAKDGGPESATAGGSGVGGSIGIGGSSGTGGSSAPGGSSPGGSSPGGMGGAGATGGSSGAGGAGGTGATGGTSGAGGTGGAGGTAATGGTGGAGGSVGGPCNGQCTDPNATCSPSGVCSCKKGYTDTDSSPNDNKATCVKSSTIRSLTVSVGVHHPHCGELTYKLIGPSGQVITLMSRPGFTEAADNGQQDQEGNLAQLSESYPLTFDDNAGTSAEQVGAGLTYSDTVCANTPTCNYHPNQGAATGPATLSDAFAGKDSNGTWKLCVGDSVDFFQFNGTGSIRNWSLAIVTWGGNVNKASGAINVSIPDNGYDGTTGPKSMGCSSIKLP